MFTPEEREEIRSKIIAAAKHDQRISGGAITGSAAIDKQDQWSDIDLAFGVRDADHISNIVKDYTEKMYRDHHALHHMDVLSGTWVYRVFFLANTLQVDLAFAPQDDFGARASTFKPIFGATNQISYDPPMTKDSLIGWAWLYALHVRACIERGNVWRAEYMISGMRNQIISLCCLRHDLPERHGRGIDRLPVGQKNKLESGLVKSLECEELSRAFDAVMDVFLEEIRIFDQALFTRLEPALTELASYKD